MRALVYYVALTLDGRIAGPRGEFDFFPVGDPEQAAAYAGAINARYPETVPTAFRTAAGVAEEPNRRFDTVVMGAGTYRLNQESTGVTSPYAHLRQYVVSSTLAPDTDPAVTVTADPLALVRSLKAEPGADIWLCGGGRLAGALLPEIDALILKTYPVVAGAGVPAFDGGFDPTAFTVTERAAFANGAAVTWLARR
ncbi:dihydrofolate reductase family protein [Streptomonospora sp. S1-112]|uniref:Dihydrofolate reductase family protein n=1 Tax=Streptomonospora mangrovi TaxID=2883123 RepID=A0A9X3NGN3_9ACTN|nr:dihydrofolate reductase family protein [Streptomonospora mangrovi]MDA0563359.1 dihydrofolate reductase family protein [Streptomonospora mangrovi]